MHWSTIIVRLSLYLFKRNAGSVVQEIHTYCEKDLVDCNASILLDEVKSKLDATVQGAVPLPVISGSMPAQLMQAAGGAEITITKNGYLFVFLSSESQGTVYFDDLSIQHTPGNLLEEHHYYPTGLEMFALSSSASNGHVRNRYGYQGQERENTFALNLNEFEARHYDPQTGRWMVPDPANQFPSPYVGMGNQWVSGVDPDGRWVHIVVGAAIGGIVNWAMNGARFDAKGLGYFGVGAIAGGLSAGIGSGLNVSMAGGSFGAGFAGTATGVASTGFLSGAATGAAAGLTSGFISGTGNSLVGGQNLGKAFNNGFRQAGKQGLSGGLLGGLSGGIDAFRKDLNVWSGKTSLDLAKGYGAHGIDDLNQVITGKYVGTYEGINMYESDRLLKVDASGNRFFGGITLPGRGIIVGTGAHTYNLAPNLLQHEFGHILQARMVGYHAFYSVIGKESLLSASMNGKLGHQHKTFWTETWANYLSKNYFGTRYIANETQFPVKNLNWFHLLRLLRKNPFIIF